MSDLEFCVLGALEVRDRGVALQLGKPRTRTVLGVLLTRPNSVVSVDRLVDELWPDDPPSGARSQIHDYVCKLRRELRGNPNGAVAADRLVTRSPGYLIEIEPGELDQSRFEELLHQARTENDLEKAHQHYLDAHRIWRGEPFADVPPTNAITAAAMALTEQRITSLESRFALALELGSGTECVGELTALVDDYPLRERLVAQLMSALAQSGRTADALEVGRRTKDRLAEELGIDPGPAIREAEIAILRGELHPATRSAPEPARSDIVPAQLPPDLAAFTGRDAELGRLLEPPARRGGESAATEIAVIAGMAGVGKTALAVRAAHELADRYPDGQIFVDLHGYTQGLQPVEPEAVLDRILRDLGVPGDQIPDGLEARAGLYRSRIAAKRMLIVLDNAATQAQIEPLLPGAPGCRVLITSRCLPTRIDASQIVTLDSLPSPDAVRLLARLVGERTATSASPETLRGAVELCGRLPLAISLAAARLNSHPSWTVGHLSELLAEERDRLAELEAGTRSVTAALDLSYRQLCPEARRAYRLLGLHPGPRFDAYGAAALARTDIGQARRLLERLLEAHLLREAVPGRYDFHDLTRAHAAQTAAAEDGDEERHAATLRLLDYYRRTAAKAMDAVYPGERDRRPDTEPCRTPIPHWRDTSDAGDWLDTEQSNLLAAARFAMGYGQGRYTMDLSTLLHEHLRTGGRYSDAETLHSLALKVARLSEDTVGELDATVCLGYVYRRRGRFEDSVELFAQAIGVARATCSPSREASAMVALGHVRRLQGQFDRADELFERARATALTQRHRSRELSALIGQAHVHRLQGRFDSAAMLFGQAIEAARTAGDRSRELRARFGLGHVWWQQRRFDQALSLFEEGMAIARSTGDLIGETSALIGFAYIHMELGHHEVAAEEFDRARALAAAAGGRNWEFEALRGLGELRLATGHFAESEARNREALVIATELSKPDDQARAHDGLARAYERLGRDAEARRHWLRALKILGDLGTEHTEEGASAPAIRAALSELEQP